MPTRRRPLSIAFAAATYAFALVAFAAESAPTTAARLEVEAAADCTTRADLAARVRARSPRVSFVEDETALGIRARFSAQPPGSVTAELTLTRSGMAPSTRRVVARSCTEAADALALMIAVTLDPTSAEQAATASGTATPGGSETTGGGDSAATAGASAANEPATAAAPTPKPVAPAVTATATRSEPVEAEAPPEASVPSTARFDFALAAQAFVGPAPGVMPGVALYALVGVDRPRLWSPRLVFGFTHAWRTDVEEQGGTASFLLDAASLDACPIRVNLPRVELLPCASALGGRLSARGADTQNPVEDVVRPYWVLGGSALVTVHLVWHLEASARIAVGGNLVQDAFRFGTNTFHTVGDVTAAGSVGLGLRAP